MEVMKTIQESALIDYMFMIWIPDVNECSSLSLNRCSRMQTCRNTLGSYSCVCPRGFIKSSRQVNMCEGKKGSMYLSLFYLLRACPSEGALSLYFLTDCEGVTWGLFLASTCAPA